MYCCLLLFELSMKGVPVFIADFEDAVADVTLLLLLVLLLLKRIEEIPLLVFEFDV